MDKLKTHIGIKIKGGGFIVYDDLSIDVICKCGSNLPCTCCGRCSVCHDYYACPFYYNTRGETMIQETKHMKSLKKKLTNIGITLEVSIFYANISEQIQIGKSSIARFGDLQVIYQVSIDQGTSAYIINFNKDHQVRDFCQLVDEDPDFINILDHANWRVCDKYVNRVLDGQA